MQLGLAVDMAMRRPHAAGRPCMHGMEPCDWRKPDWDEWALHIEQKTRGTSLLPTALTFTAQPSALLLVRTLEVRHTSLVYLTVVLPLPCLFNCAPLLCIEKMITKLKTRLWSLNERVSQLSFSLLSQSSVQFSCWFSFIFCLPGLVNVGWTKKGNFETVNITHISHTWR